MNLPKNGRLLADIESDFMFGGEIPDDDRPNGLPDENEIDANNDETFGAELDAGDIDELEDYAAQTACLRLEDDGWDRPGCSAAAPDISQIPLPEFDLGVFGTSPLDTLLGSESVRQFDSIWTADTSTSQKGFSIWDNSGTNSGLKDSMPPFMAAVGSQPTTGNLAAPGTRNVLSSSPLNVPPMPKAPTLEELERGRIGSGVPSSTVPRLPVDALSAEELERRILLEAAMNQQTMLDTTKISTVAQAHTDKQFNILPPKSEADFRSIGSGVAPPGAPPMFPPLPPMFVPFVPVWMDLMVGRIKFLPPGCPPVPPFLGHMLNYFKDPNIVMSVLRASMANAPPMPPPVQPNNFGGYHRKPPGMPSGRTIEDLAFDQFAGYMSCKERQWLVKIQILQCQGNGNPGEDDYYYVCWRQKRLAEGWKPAPVKCQPEAVESKENQGGRSNRRQRERERASNNSHQTEVRVVGDKFAGSLGIPSKSTTSNPRHLIRFETPEPAEDEPEAKVAGTQKKLRTLLLRIESATLLLLEAGSHKQGGQADLANRINLIVKELCGEDLPKVLSINKGRQLLCRILRMAASKDQAKVLSSILSCCRGLAAKNVAEISSQLTPGIYSAFSSLDREKMVDIVSALDIGILRQAIVEKNLVCRDIFLCIILLCAKKKASVACPLFQWLKGADSSIDWLNGWSAPITWQLPAVTSMDVMMLHDWLKLMVVEPSTVARQLADALISSKF